MESTLKTNLCKRKFALLLFTQLLLVVFLSTTWSQTPLIADASIVEYEYVNDDIRLSFDLTSVQRNTDLIDNSRYDVQTLPNEGMICEYGYPILPAVTRFVVVPADKGLALNISTDEPQITAASHPPLICLDEEIASAQSIFSEADEQSVYPPEFATMGEPIVIRGVRLVPVTVYPVQYDPGNNTFIYRSNIQTEIVTTDDPPVNPASHTVRKYRSTEFLNLINGLAINGDMVGRDDPDEIAPYVGHYLVVTHTNCLQYAAEWIEWRRKSGYKVDIFSLSDNDARNSNTILNGIRTRYEDYLDDGIDPFEYVLLIGDHSNYSGTSFQPGWVLESGSAVNDHTFANLEGNDQVPDVAISRWCAGTAGQMGLFVGRTMAYEANPRWEDNEWMDRGAVYSQYWAGNYNVHLATNVRWAKAVLEEAGMTDIRVEENIDQQDSPGFIVGPFIRDQFNEGVNLMVGRAENYYFRSSLQGVNRNTVFPIDINIAGHHEWTTWVMLKSGDVNNLMGPVACTTGWGNPPTMPMSVTWLEMVNGFVCRDLAYGWSRVQGITAPYQYYSNYPANLQTNTIVYYGDPGMRYWKGIPQNVAADFPESISPETRSLEVYVYDVEEETDVKGAQVTIYAPGNMPAYNHANYAGYDGMQMWTATSDANGEARFIFDEAVFEDIEEVYVTITGREIRPHFGEITVEQPESGIDLSEVQLTESDGNNNNRLNPGETFELIITAKNIGEQDLQGITAMVSTESPYARIEGEGVLEFGDISNDESIESQNAVTIVISTDCPDGSVRPGSKPLIDIRFSSDNHQWTSGFYLDVEAPNLTIDDLLGDDIVPGNALDYELEFVIKNIGRQNVAETTAELIPLNLILVPIEGSITYPAISINRTSRPSGNVGFSVAANQIAVPGSQAEIMVVFHTDEGFSDTASFSIQVGEPSDNAPQGPDGYGYYCFDDTDQDWEIAPEYDWIEISLDEQNRDYNGTEMDFDGQSPQNLGEALLLDLPFETQFYGRLYDQITVCTNGYISMGDQTYGVNPQNWPLDRGIGGGMGMLAPFWDKLTWNQNTDIYYYYSEEDAYFIVEWYKIGTSNNIFQVILYDHDVWITETGDQTILFQYKQIDNIAGGDNWSNDVPYASVGICSPDGTTGINYTYNNRYPVTSARLENRRAILFATTPEFLTGYLSGYVRDYETDQPIFDAVVITEHGLATRTDENGFYEIPRALAEVPFDITVRCIAYNDTTEFDKFIAEDDTLELNFELLHPEFTPSTRQLAIDLDPDREHRFEFSVTNSGNGPLDWRLRKRLPGNADVDPWLLRESIHVSDTVIDSRLNGVAFVNNKFYVTGGGNNEQNWTYVLDKEGRELSRFPAFKAENISRYGMNDIAWDGELLWAADNHFQVMYGFTTEGVLTDSLNVPLRPVRSVTWDPHRQVFWFSGISNQLYGFDRAGNQRFELTNSAVTNLRRYGLAYFTEDPDGFNLYVQARTSGIDGTGQAIYKINVETGDTLLVATLPVSPGIDPSGAFISNQFDVYSWVFFGISDSSSHDRIDVWQIESRRDWYKLFYTDLEPEGEVGIGKINADVTENFTLLLSSQGLPQVPFLGEMIYYHNATGASDTIFVELNVIGDVPPSGFNLTNPPDSSQIYVTDSTYITFLWEQSNDPNWDDSVSYELWFANGQSDFRIAVLDTTSIVIDKTQFDEITNQEVMLNWWVNAVSGEDTVRCTEPFKLLFIPDEVEMASGLPVKFGIESIYPSPFNSTTTIHFGLDQPERVRILVYDLMGREVAVLYDNVAVTGNYRYLWNAKGLPSGVYVVRLAAGSRTQVAKVALIR